MAEISCKIKVIIIGAGISGLACAEVLSKHKDLFDVTVLEARNRLGGRLDTRKFGSTTVDVGAMWMHRTDDNELFNRANEIGLKLDFTSEEQKLFDEETNDHIKILPSPPIIDTRGNCYSTEGKLFFEEWDKIVQEVEDQYGNLKDINGLVGDHVKDMPVIDKFHELASERGVDVTLKNQISESLYNRLVNSSSASLSGYYAGELNRLSAKYMGFLNETGADKYIMNGYSTVVDYLAKDLDVKLNTQVLKIICKNTSEDKYNDQSHCITLETNAGEMTCDYVVVTVPLGCLKHNAVEFEPALPSRKQKAIGRLGAGVIGKVVLIFKRRFWNKEFGWIKVVPDPEQISFTGMRSFYKHTLQPILIAFVPPTLCKTIELREDEEVIQEALQILSGFYGPEVNQLFEQGFVTRWGTDPFSRGAYSYIEVGGTPEDYSMMAEPLFGDRVLFAGEHTTTYDIMLCTYIALHRSHPATVGGAYASGVREARRLIEQITA